MEIDWHATSSRRRYRKRKGYGVSRPGQTLSSSIGYTVLQVDSPTVVVGLRLEQEEKKFAVSHGMNGGFDTSAELRHHGLISFR
jgi:hypothetical protein